MMWQIHECATCPHRRASCLRYNSSMEWIIELSLQKFNFPSIFFPSLASSFFTNPYLQPLRQISNFLVAEYLVIMSNQQEDLDLLLSLQERVLETPPASPSTHHSQSPDYLSDNGSPRQRRNSDMSVFKDTVRDYLENEPDTVDKGSKFNRSKHSNDVDVEKFSGLRIRKLLVSHEELSNHFSDIRFVRLPAIRNLLVGDTISGSWATAGVLSEKGIPKVSSTGKNYCIWKIGCLDEKTLSVFLFGDAYTRNCKEQVGTVFALFNSGVRKDNEGNGFSLSVFSAGQILKIGTSVDYGVCKAKRKDGVACTVAINKRRGTYCKYHTANASQKYSVTRAELKGGNLKTGFRNPLQAEGIYLVDPLSDKKNFKKVVQPVKVLSVDGLKKALSKAGKVTTNAHSQGIRFLTEVTGKMHPNELKGGSAALNQQRDSTGKMHPKNIRRDSAALNQHKDSTGKMCPKDLRGVSAASNQQKDSTLNRSFVKLSSTTNFKDQPEAKRKKPEQPTEKMIELDLFSSDEDV